MKHAASERRAGAIRAALLAGIGAMVATQAQAQANAPAMPAEKAPPVVAAEWRQQKVDFPFSAFTSFYSCTGLEDKMRLILLTFGARPDLKVHAYSCDRASDKPNRTAWVAVEFSALVPARDATAPGAVKAIWKDVRLEPNRPHDMGMGECELVEQMAGMLKKGFTLKDVRYQTTCVPKQVSVGDYSVRAQSLQAASTLQAETH